MDRLGTKEGMEMARKQKGIEEALSYLRGKGYEITYHDGLDNYTITDGERSAIRSIKDLVIWASTGRDPFNWLPPL